MLITEHAHASTKITCPQNRCRVGEPRGLGRWSRNSADPELTAAPRWFLRDATATRHIPGSGADCQFCLTVMASANCGQRAESGRPVRAAGLGRRAGRRGSPPRSTGPNVVITHAGQPRRIRPPHPAVAPLGAGPSRFCEHLLRPREGEFYRIPTERELEEQRGPLS